MKSNGLSPKLILKYDGCCIEAQPSKPVTPPQEFGDLIQLTVLLGTSANWKAVKPVPKPRKHFGIQSCGKHRN